MNVKTKIKDLVNDLFDQVVTFRRHIHQWPELSFEESETARYVCSILDSFGIGYAANIGGHGIVALIQGELPGESVVALRGDMDALPIQEENTTPYRSKKEGIMHACGHDVHTSSLLGAAIVLQQLKAGFGGTVKCIFQPAEEKLPGGASLMIKDKALENPTPSVIFGQHVHPPLQVGKVGVKGGMYMASTDELYLTVKGRGGHAALPQDLIDPVMITANILVALQQVVSRHGDPTIPTVLSFGKIHSTGGSTNVIPGEVKLEGTFRTMDEPWRKKAHDHMLQICNSVAEAHGGRAELTIMHGYPYLLNDDQLTDRFRINAIEYLGAENVVDLPIRMTGEDFAYYSQIMPACFYRLGTGNPEKGITSPIHTATFDVDEECLKVGVGVMVFSALCELGRMSS
ncbi:MAG: amidohydrolase [Saprospiraceae bacterium]|nr:amidohydrolase [Saprospiraceae bacterium]